MRIFYATDVHGSDRCFTKFVNAGKFYGADAVVLGGDITGKAIVPLSATGDGRRQGQFLGELVTVSEGNELQALEQKIASTGYYPWRCTAEEEEQLRNDPAATESLFLTLITERLERWLGLAEERLKPRGIPCYINAGNDDASEVDAILEQAGWVQFLEGRVVELPDGTQMASCGFANRTPWDCPRDVEEEELADRYEAVVAKLDAPSRALFNFHCPPYDTGIDSGPKLGEDLRLKSGAGGVEMQPVGSKACRAAIEEHQPLVGLHGHLHESRGTYKLGRTLCLNPGSEYTEGVLRGSLIEISKGKLRSQQFTAG